MGALGPAPRRGTRRVEDQGTRREGEHRPHGFCSETCYVSLLFLPKPSAKRMLFKTKKGKKERNRENRVPGKECGSPAASGRGASVPRSRPDAASRRPALCRLGPGAESGGLPPDP